MDIKISLIENSINKIVSTALEQMEVLLSQLYQREKG